MLSIKKYIICFEFLGLDFFGSQKQPDKRTVQNEIEKALCTLIKDKINIIKIDRNGEEYYYVTSAENTAEIKIKGGQITRINSASVTE